MFKGIIVAGALAMSTLSIACVASAQTSTNERTRDLVAQLDKTKHKVKDKGNVHIELYTEVRNEAVVQSPASLSGHYSSDVPGTYEMNLSVNSDGTATASGYDSVGLPNAVRTNYSFAGRLDGALLSGTRTYEDGRKEAFDAVFVRRTVRSGTSEKDATVTQTAFGVGYILKGDNWNSRVFLEKQ